MRLCLAPFRLLFAAWGTARIKLSEELQDLTSLVVIPAIYDSQVKLETHIY